MCSRQKRSPKLQDKLAEAQGMMTRPVLKVVLDTATRWNSLLDMLLRFNEMKDVLVFITNDRLSNYNWEKSKICSLLKPLKKCALELQKSYAGPGVAIKVIRFLNHVARNEAAMTSSVQSVLSKWIDGSAIANGICHKSGEIFEHIRELKLKENSNSFPVLITKMWKVQVLCRLRNLTERKPMSNLI